jgi:glycosyltransferase involved in cell wall biosynthesis
MCAVEGAISKRRRPKILFLTPHWPLAAAYGAQQRVLNIAGLISRVGDLSFVILPLGQEDDEVRRRTQKEFSVRAIIRPSLRSERPRGLAHRLRHEFDPNYMITDPYEIREADRNFLEKLVQEHDMVWVHTIAPAQWFRIHRWHKSVLDVDDLPSRCYESAAQSGQHAGRRLLDLRMKWIWRRRERMLPSRFSVLTVCSEEDRRYMRSSGPVYVIPNGCNLVTAPRRVVAEIPILGFLGNCEFSPNEEGVKWFIDDVWPSIKREIPTAKLRLVGRASDGYLSTLGPDIVGRGWLKDPTDEIACWSAMIVPIKSGSGTRVKVVEGFARKCPIVATTIGAFGYDATDGKELLVADSADRFANACISLLKNPNLGEQLAKRAHGRFVEQLTWDSFEKNVRMAVADCLSTRDYETSRSSES